MYGQLTLLVIAAITVTSPVSKTTIAIAGIVVAVVVVIGGILVIRSGKNKGAKTSGSAGQTDWQRQAQPGGTTGWNQNQQAMGNMGGINSDAPSWAQQGQQGQQGGQNGWNNQGMGMPQQQAQPNAWGVGQDVPSQNPSWAAQGNQSQAAPWAAQNNPNQTQQPAWMQGQGAQQSSSPAWAAQNNPAPQAAANSWNNPGTQAAQGSPGARAPWDAGQPASAQDSWGMQAPAAQSQGTQQPQFGNSSAPSWNQPGFAGAQNVPAAGPNDAWSAGTPQPQSQYAPQGANNAMGGFSAPPTNNAPQAPAWQGNYGQGNAAQPMGSNAANGIGWQGQPLAENTMLGGVDNDRTMIRTSGSGLGVVRVEEGKEPGREYEIRKESLSIGRSRESDIFLEDLAVSRLHSSIVNQGNGNYALKDEGSANGTKINGQLVGKYQTYPLQDGDRIQLGQTVLVFGHR